MGPYNSIDMSCLDIITFLPEANNFNVTTDTHIGIIYGFRKELLSKAKKSNSFNLKRNNVAMNNILAELETDFDIDKLKPIKEINQYIPSNFKLICCWPTIDNQNTKDTSSIVGLTDPFAVGFQQMFQKIFIWLFKYSRNRFHFQQAVTKFYLDYENNIGNEYKKILKLSSIDNVDKCLYQLNQINDLDYLENDALKFQLEKLKNIYTIETKLNEDKKIIALDKQYPVEKIKEIMIRLLDVEPDLKKKLDSPLTKSKLSSPKIPASYLPNDICPNFVGRKNILTQIRENFSGKNKQIVILNSISGGGKSCIANEYGKEWRKMPDCIVLWIDSTSKNLDKKFSNVSKSFGIFTDKNRSVERLIQIVQDKIQNLSQNFLFIFDNCEDLAKIETYLNNLPKNAFALVTTRNNKIQESLIKTSLIISLEPFNEDETKQFEQKILGLTETNLATVLELIFKFHKNKMIIPFDLNIITRTIKIEIESNSFENFIESNKADDYMAFGEKINRGVLFELLESIDKDAVQILFYSSFLDPFLIPIKIYTKFFKLEMNKKTQDILTDNSLISEVLNEYGKCFIIHSLTQEKISQYLKRKENKQLEITIENKLCEVLSDFDHIVKDISKKEIRTNNYHNNFERIINKVLESKTVSKEQKVSYILNYARFNEGLDNYEKAQEYFEKSLEYFEKEDFKSIANVWNSIGSVYRSQEKYELALAKHEDSLELFRMIYKADEHSSIAETLNKIGSVYLSQSKYELALDKHEESLKLFRSIHKADEHSSIAETLNKIGSVYLSQSKYDLAINRFRKSLEILRKIHGTDKNLSIGQTHNNIGLTYYNQGKNFLALDYYEKSLHVYKNVYESEKNSSSAITYNNIGLVYYTQGKYDLALKSYEKAYEIYRKIYGTDEHSLIITTLNNIGSVYLNQKKFDLAIEKHEQSIEISKNLYKTNENSLSAETYCKIGTAYSMQEKPELAFKFYQESLDIYTKINDAGNNYNVAQILNKIGLDYFSQNKYSLAIEYYKKSLEILLKIYAIEENSLITITLNNIATVYYTNKEYELAIDYYEKSLEIYRKIDDTSSIETTLNNIQLVKYKIDENYRKKNYKNRMIFFTSNFFKKLQQK